MMSEDLRRLLAGLEWVKAEISGGNNSNGCLERAVLPDGRVAIRDSEDPDTVIICSAHSWSCFLDGAKKGELDVAV